MSSRTRSRMRATTESCASCFGGEKTVSPAWTISETGWQRALALVMKTSVQEAASSRLGAVRWTLKPRRSAASRACRIAMPGRTTSSSAVKMCPPSLTTATLWTRPSRSLRSSSSSSTRSTSSKSPPTSRGFRSKHQVVVFTDGSRRRPRAVATRFGAIGGTGDERLSTRTSPARGAATTATTEETPEEAPEEAPEETPETPSIASRKARRTSSSSTSKP
mmetsp:Transcript_25368/g.82056  ORF Transcript_25368/g.82056 Transcript_25368/m.82056 type:complete len:220 (+) Transcript_25368:121-780(+)